MIGARLVLGMKCMLRGSMVAIFVGSCAKSGGCVEHEGADNGGVT